MSVTKVVAALLLSSVQSQSAFTVLPAETTCDCRLTLCELTKPVGSTEPTDPATVSLCVPSSFYSPSSVEITAADQADKDAAKYVGYTNADGCRPTIAPDEKTAEWMKCNSELYKDCGSTFKGCTPTF